MAGGCEAGLKIIGAQLYPICLPLAKAVTNAQARVTERRGTLVRLVSDSGEAGWGEASPYPGFGLESLEASRSVLADAAAALIGSDVARLDELQARVTQLTMSSGCARAAVETAVLDLWARAERKPMFELLTPEHGAAPRMIECNALVTGDELDALERAARTELANGFGSFKLKLGALDLERDLARVARLREVVGPSAKIRLDANQGYGQGVARDIDGMSDALAALESFACHQIEYLEQPLAADALETMAALCKNSPVPLAADESVVTETDALRVIEAGAADLLVIKPSALGGPSASLRVARAARQAGVGVVVTSLLDSAVGVSAAHQVAIAIASEGALPACGLATGGLLARDVALLEPPVRGCLPHPTRAGLGIEMDESRVRKLLAAPVMDLSR